MAGWLHGELVCTAAVKAILVVQYNETRSRIFTKSWNTEAQSEVSEKARPSAVVEMKLRVWTSLMSSSNRDEVTAAARHRFTAQNKLLRL